MSEIELRVRPWYQRLPKVWWAMYQMLRGAGLSRRTAAAEALNLTWWSR